MLLEIHAHTKKYSPCSRIDPVALVRRVSAQKLQGVLITEHHYLWTPHEIDELRTTSGAERNFVILAAQEIETEKGHVIVYGADKTIDGHVRIAAIRESFPDAAIVLAHPFRKGLIPNDALLLSSDFDAIEIFNSNHSVTENYSAIATWHRLKFTAVAGSDAHSIETAGIYPTIFDHPVTSVEEIAREIKNRRVRPFFKEIPKSGGNVTVTEITIGTKGPDEYRRRIILKSFDVDKQFKKSISAAEISGAAREKGFSSGTFRVPATLDIRQSEKIIIEEGQRGKNLYEVIRNSSPDVGKKYLQLAGAWLAKFHSVKLHKIIAGDRAKTLEREIQRLERYEKSFVSTKSPHTDDARKIITYLIHNEKKMIASDTLCVLCHGDYHPKNIIIGQDISHDISTLFVSVIDFASASVHLPAFDVGYFWAQFENQFFGVEEVRRLYREEDFTAAYFGALRVRIKKTAWKNRERLISFFKMRSYMSIANFLIKVGKGESEELSQIIKKSLKIMRI